MIAEEILIPSSGGPVYATQRIFRGECPKCGRVRTVHRGHHATIQEKEMKERMFPKDVRAIISNKLDVEDLKTFKLAVEGKIHPTTEQLQLWKSLGGYYRL